MNDINHQHKNNNMENTNDKNRKDAYLSEVEKKNAQIKKSDLPTPEQGVQHDDEGNIIKVAENAVPPKAWENQKKAYSDAYENNRNQQLEDDII